MHRAEERAGPEDVGQQALMRGLDTAFPFFVWGCPGLHTGVRKGREPHRLADAGRQKQRREQQTADEQSDIVHTIHEKPLWQEFS
jgi:hypothetical protein